MGACRKALATLCSFALALSMLSVTALEAVAAEVERVSTALAYDDAMLVYQQVYGTDDWVGLGDVALMMKRSDVVFEDVYYYQPDSETPNFENFMVTYDLVKSDGTVVLHTESPYYRDGIEGQKRASDIQIDIATVGRYNGAFLYWQKSSDKMGLMLPTGEPLIEAAYDDFFYFPKREVYFASLFQDGVYTVTVFGKNGELIQVLEADGPEDSYMGSFDVCGSSVSSDAPDTNLLILTMRGHSYNAKQQTCFYWNGQSYERVEGVVSAMDIPESGKAVILKEDGGFYFWEGGAFTRSFTSLEELNARELYQMSLVGDSDSSYISIRYFTKEGRQDTAYFDLQGNRYENPEYGGSTPGNDEEEYLFERDYDSKSLLVKDKSGNLLFTLEDGENFSYTSGRTICGFAAVYKHLSEDGRSSTVLFTRNGECVLGGSGEINYVSKLMDNIIVAQLNDGVCRFYECVNGESLIEIDSPFGASEPHSYIQSNLVQSDVLGKEIYVVSSEAEVAEGTVLRNVTYRHYMNVNGTLQPITIGEYTLGMDEQVSLAHSPYMGSAYDSGTEVSSLLMLNNKVCREAEGFYYAHDAQGNYGIVDEQGEVILPFEYEGYFDAGDPDATCILLKKDGAWGFYTIDSIKGGDPEAPDDSAFSDVVAEGDGATPHADDVLWLAAQGISTGFPDGTFRPYDSVARCDMAAFLYRLAGSPEYVPSEEVKARFSDVTEATDHAKEVWWLAENGISTGFPDGTFRPYDTIVRCDMAAFLHRLAGEGAGAGGDASAFADVDASTPHAEDILWLAANGVSAGWDEADGTKTFRPYEEVARCDMAAFMHRQSGAGLVAEF